MMAPDVQGVVARYNTQRARVHAACARVGREPAEVTLIAVSKQHPVALIQALADEGVRDFGESYVQEWVEKAAVMPQLRWHFVGRVQSNKIAKLRRQVALVHSVSSTSHITSFGSRRTTRPQDILIQVNLAGEAAKSGCAPSDALHLVRVALETDGVRPTGLMTMPPLAESAEMSRKYFSELNRLAGEVRGSLSTSEVEQARGFRHLSMGMSDDMEIAIEEGATHVRVGTAIFGERQA